MARFDHDQQIAPRQQHDVVLTSGTDKLKTKVSFGYQNVGAFYDNFNYERYQFRVNNDIKFNNKFSAVADVSFRRINAVEPVVDPIYESRVMPSNYPAYNVDGSYSIAKDGRNPLAQLNEGGDFKDKNNQLQGRLGLNFKPITDLTLSATISPTFDFNKRKSFSKKIPFLSRDGSPAAATNTPLTVLSETRGEIYQITGQFLANYNKSFDNKHNVGALVGYESIYFSTENLTGRRDGYPLLDFPYLNVGSTTLRKNSGDASEESLHSIFGRVTYDYMGKYLFQANIRRDQSSRFADGFRSAIYPSFSAGWSISEENFMKDIKWVNFLKLRASYGEVGNQRISLGAGGAQLYYPYAANVVIGNALFYQNGVLSPQSTGGQRDYAVRDIRWETTRSTDVGIDATFLENRLNVTADYFKKSTKDILMQLDIPLNLGYDKPIQNAGILDVNGWELGLNWKDKINDFTYNVGFNISDSKSKIKDMKGTRQETGNTLVNMEGSEFNEWYGYLNTGIYQTVPEASTAKTVQTVTAGDLGYKDVDGNGIINLNDRVFLGGSLPRYQYGGNINLGYKGFDFGVNFQGVGKKISKLSNDVVRPFLEQFGNFPTYLDGKFWRPGNTPEQNTATSFPRLTNINAPNNYVSSDFWLVNGAYFRLKNATLGYTFNKKDILQKIGLQSVRVYIAANDFLTISKFPKFSDPESGNLTTNNGTYPIVTTFLGGVSVKF